MSNSASQIYVCEYCARIGASRHWRCYEECYSRFQAGDPAVLRAHEVLPAVLLPLSDTLPARAAHAWLHCVRVPMCLVRPSGVLVGDDEAAGRAGEHNVALER